VNNTHNRFMALFPGPPTRWAGARFLSGL